MTSDSESKPEFVFAADLGGTHLRTAVVDREGKISGKKKQRTPGSKEPGAIVRALVDGVRECEADVNIAAVSVAVPGTVNVSEGLVMTAPNLKSLDDFALGPALSKELGRPVTIENDANAAAVGEWWRGAGRGYRTLICVTLGTGVGGGIILEGKLWRGVDGSAGEIGHIAVDPFADVTCSCGSSGCLEVYASATALVRLTREMKVRFPDSVLREVGELTAEKIFEAALEKDELAIRVFTRMGTHLGIGLASLINLINPEVIVIAGGVANAWEVFEAEVRHQINKRAFPIPAQRAKVAKGQCGDDAGLLGAAWLAFDES
jgi:glucokinase